MLHWLRLEACTTVSGQGVKEDQDLFCPFTIFLHAD